MRWKGQSVRIKVQRGEEGGGRKKDKAKCTLTAVGSAHSSFTQHVSYPYPPNPGYPSVSFHLSPTVFGCVKSYAVSVTFVHSPVGMRIVSVATTFVPNGMERYQSLTEELATE